MPLSLAVFADFPCDILRSSERMFKNALPPERNPQIDSPALFPAGLGTPWRSLRGSPVNSRAPAARTGARVSRTENQQPGSQVVNVGFAAHFLGISSDRVKILCHAGVLAAERNRHGSWRIDEDFLIQWREAYLNTLAAAGCESNEGEEQRALSGSAAPPKLAVQAPCPPNSCEAHWSRCGRAVPALRAGLCRSCCSGRPLPAKADEGASMD